VQPWDRRDGGRSAARPSPVCWAYKDAAERFAVREAAAGISVGAALMIVVAVEAKVGATLVIVGALVIKAARWI